MSMAFNADEILRIAEQIERNGAAFYRHAATRAGDDRGRALLAKLAEFEDSHERTFATMRVGLADEEREATTFDPEGESEKYLAALADRRVFDVTADLRSRLRGDESLADVLGVALGAEKDSIIFYLGMKDMVPKGRGRERVEQIIREEMSHITTLVRELAGLKQ